MKSAPGIGAVLLTIALLTCGCSASQVDVSKYQDVRARLDLATETIAMPIDRYVLKGRDAYTVEHANAVLVKQCMLKYGYQFPLADLNWDSFYPNPDRLYGIFSPQRAASNGYLIPTPAALYDEQQREDQMPDAWWVASKQCTQITKQLPLHQLNSSSRPSSADLAVRATYDQASHTEVWKKAVADWTDCLKQNGLVPAKDSGFTPELPSDPQAQAEIAVVDVGCKTQTQFVQRIADIQARFEAAYIDAHQAELEADLKQTNDDLVKARRILNSGA